MQVTKLVIASVSVLAARAAGLPEGNECVLRCESSSHVVCYTKVVCSVIGYNCCVLTVCEEQNYCDVRFNAPLLNTMFLLYCTL